MHICNGTGFSEDGQGVELPDEIAARRTAIEAARDVMASDVRAGELDLSSFIEVEDEDKNLLFTLTFIEAIVMKSAHAGQRPERKVQ